MHDKLQESNDLKVILEKFASFFRIRLALVVNGSMSPMYVGISV